MSWFVLHLNVSVFSFLLSLVPADAAKARCWNCKSAAEVKSADNLVKSANAMLKEDNDNLVCTSYSKGVASWYAGNFIGRLTANGERYTARTLTAAHRKLPFGTLVKVTYNTPDDAEKSIIVRINDRGPFIKGRVLDLSLDAFKKLASPKKGLLTVKLETCVTPEDQRVASKTF